MSDLETFVRDYVNEHSFDDAQCAACGTVRWEHVDHFLAALAPHIAAERDAALRTVALLAERDATIERVRELADSWVAADGEPATAADLTVMNVLNRCGRQVRAALESQ